MPENQKDFRKMDYLGDGVYSIYDDYGIWLYANDHKNPTDRIYLEPDTLIKLNNFAKRMEEINGKITD